MGGRRFIYITFLLLVGVLHFFYEQYISKYMLLFVLCLPVLSLLLSLPAMLTARIQLTGERKVHRGQKASLELEMRCPFILPLYCFTARMGRENLFTGEKTREEKLCLYGITSNTRSITIPTDRCGVVCCTLKRGWAWDYLGLFALPVKLSGDAYITVLPVEEVPVPLPELIENSALTLKPKPGGGYSEEHELRPYRQGDAINSIHWKLTSKLDSPIVREPQLMQRKRITLLVNPVEEGEGLESQLGQLLYLTHMLIEMGVACTAYFGSLRQYIRAQKDVEVFLKTILSSRKNRGKAPHIRSDQEGLVYTIQPGNGEIKKFTPGKPDTLRTEEEEEEEDE